MFLGDSTQHAECVEEFEEKEALRLEKAIYGLVQAARHLNMRST